MCESLESPEKITRKKRRDRPQDHSVQSHREHPRENHPGISSKPNFQL
jgi:hypothetical protein